MKKVSLKQEQVNTSLKKEGFQELNKNDELYKQMFQLSLIPILIHDMKMNIIDANQRAIEEFGYPKDELLKKKVFDLHTESELEHSSQVLEQMRKENKLSVETSFVRKDGSVFMAEATPCKYIFNNKPLIHVYIQNITQRKKYESLLIKAMEKAEESDRLKSAFLANMSHELRTPMNAIFGFASLINEKNKTRDEIEHYANIILNSSEHLLSLINDIIDISIIGAGTIKISKSTFGLNALLKSLYNFFHSYLVAKSKFHIFLKLNIPESECYIVSDETRLRQILNNLLSNAVKFTEEGVVEFGYTIEGELIKFFVKDTGIGIPEDKKDIIFERFQKVAGTKEKLYEGTGLGLSIALACSQLLKGKLWFDSKVNVGTSFYFTLKLESGNEDSEQRHSEIKDDFIFNKELILVAEDDDYNFAFLETFLKDHNLKLIRTTTGRETIKQALQHSDISLILMDIKMPDLSGIEATREIKKQKPDLPIIAQTAYAYESDRLEILKAGCIDYLTKPIDKIRLLNTILKNIQRKIA